MNEIHIDSLSAGESTEFNLGWKPSSVVVILHKELPSVQGRVSLTVTGSVVKIENCGTKTITGLRVFSKEGTG